MDPVLASAATLVGCVIGILVARNVKAYVPFDLASILGGFVVLVGIHLLT